jgi:hypothetical protein
MRVLKTAELRLGSAFKYGYFAGLALLLPLTTLMGLLGMFGLANVNYNGRPVHGFEALVASVFAGVTIPLSLAVPLLLGTAMLRLFKRWAPLLEDKHAP